MESPISLKKESFTHGILPHQSQLEPTTVKISPINLKQSKPSMDFSPPGEPTNNQESVSRRLPTAEEIMQTKPPPSRILKITNEEFEQWRQVLGSYYYKQINVVNTVLDSDDP